MNAKERAALQYDGQISISTARSRLSKKWKNQTLRWSDFVQKLSETTRTRETYQVYKKLHREEQQHIKDVGGFVGGMLKEGKRKAGQVAWRSLITLDIDYPEQNIYQKINLLFGNANVIYSTHSHSPERPKLRLIFPLSRQVTPDEYEALSRFIADDIGMDMFDDTTYQPERLMFWPSTALNGEYVFQYNDGPFVNPDSILEKKPLWRDASTWPESSRASERRQKHADQQGDPLTKPGTVGAFNRAYTIPEAIEKFIPEIYTACDMPGRYTYVAGSTSAGIVLYNNETFSFSHHGTDPAGGVLVNAFDLIRIHLFHHLDVEAKPDALVFELPSYKEMQKFASEDEKVKQELLTIKQNQAREEFAQINTEHTNTPFDPAWVNRLAYSEKGSIQQSIHNGVLILRHDPNLAGLIAYDSFNRKMVLKRQPPWDEQKGTRNWTDYDDSSIKHYLEISYGFNRANNIYDAINVNMKENEYHPIQEYLNGLTWDGVPRIDKCLVDYLGVVDNEYVRAISRKWFTAGAARIRKPGIKFDHMIILVGPQGVGKSQFFSRVAKNPTWFSDSISKLDNSKESMEQLSGKWIVEIGELSAMKRYEVEHVKVFLTKQEDSYRPSYSRRTETFKRECIFGGTTNREDFLQDTTGARRFWPVRVGDTSKLWSDMTPYIVDQLWAEADIAYQLGEELYLTGAVSEYAKQEQEKYTDTGIGGKVGVAQEFLLKKLPLNWIEKSIPEKKDWLNGFDLTNQDEGSLLREEISAIELFVECFGGNVEKYDKKQSYEMAEILRELGWHSGSERKRIKDYGRQRVFKK